MYHALLLAIACVLVLEPGTSETMVGGCVSGDLCCAGSQCFAAAGCRCDSTCSATSTCCADHYEHCKGCLESTIPTVDHANSDGDGTYLFGDVITYTCHGVNQYVFQNALLTTLACMQGGSWVGDPVCLRVCSPPSVLPTVENSANDGDGSYMDGDVVMYTCDANYVLQVGSQNTQTCSSDGTFSGTSPVCLRVCSPSALPTVGNSSNDGDGSYMDGDVVTYTCDANYILQVGSQNTHTCSSDSTFSGTPPVCVRVCSPSALPTVGNSANDGDGSYIDGDVVTYTCDANYILQVGSQNAQTCSSDGTFSGTSPVCLRVCSPSSLPTVGNSANDGNGSYMDGDVVTYTCDANYILQVSSQNTQTCSSVGTFTGTSPVCLRVCSPSSLPTVGSSTNDGNGSYMDGDVVTYTCDANYILQVGSQNTQTCSSDGTFSGTSPVCLLGSPNTHTCSSDGTFSGISPVCLRVCSPSALPTVGNSANDGDGSYMDGDVVTYTCDANYILQVGSQNTQTCSSDGTFSGTSPICIRRICTTLPTVDGSTHDGDGSYMDGDVVTFTCDAGYLLYYTSPITVTCQSDGTFCTPSPVCFKTVNTQCFPNATIIVDNPDTTTYVSAHASDTTDACTTVWRSFNSIANYQLEITGCDKDSIVTVSYSSRVYDSDNIQGGANILSYVVKCEEIDATVVTRTFEQALSPVLLYTTEATVTPTFTVTSALRSTSATGTELSAATVGDELYWTLDIPDEYTAKPVSCIAYACTTTSGSPTQLMVTAGCSLDSFLMDSFSDTKVVTSVAHTRRYYTRVWAFKFHSSTNVLFHCTIMFCPTGSTDCSILCDGRKRRADDAEAVMMYGTTSRVLTVTEAVDSRSSVVATEHKDPESTGAFILAVWLLKFLLV